MAGNDCLEYARLEAEAHALLKEIGELASKQMTAFEASDSEEFVRLDHELELSMGKKERVVGALRQHAADHGCRPAFLPEA